MQPFSTNHGIIKASYTFWVIFMNDILEMLFSWINMRRCLLLFLRWNMLKKLVCHTEPFSTQGFVVFIFWELTLYVSIGRIWSLTEQVSQDKKKKEKNQKKKSFKVNIWHTVHVGRCATSIRGHFGCFLEQKHASVCFNTLRLYMYTAARHLRTKFHSIKPPLIIAKALKNKYFLSYKYQRGAKICHNKMLFKYWEWKRNTF